jgi:hypothetical protein
MGGIGSCGSGCWAEIVVADITRSNVLTRSLKWRRFFLGTAFGDEATQRQNVMELVAVRHHRVYAIPLLLCSNALAS